MHQAFVLGAGLGTRLRPLTNQLPKPLIPFFHRPLMEYAFEHLKSAGIEELIVNTHHLPDSYGTAFPNGRFQELPVTFRHEPVVLETAGGIANIADLIRQEPFVVYNGDILTNISLPLLMQGHRQSGNMITLALRSSGQARHIAFDASSGRVTDIRNKLNTGNTGTHQFTGVYIVDPAFISHLTPGKVESVIPVWLKLIESGARIGGVVLDDGIWCDLGDRETYLDAHAFRNEFAPDAPWVHPSADVAGDAVIEGNTVIGAEAKVGSGAVLRDSILWHGAVVSSGAKLTRSIVLTGSAASGELMQTDV